MSYANGLLKRVKHISGAPVYWQVNSTDAWGHFQDESFGNGVKTVSYFDQASGLMSAREGGLGGGTELIHLIVDWDLNGNLKQRKTRAALQFFEPLFLVHARLG